MVKKEVIKIPSYSIEIRDFVNCSFQRGLDRMLVLKQLLGEGYTIGLSDYGYTVEGPEIPREKLERIKRFDAVESVFV